jgi:hypothetical protein
MFLLICLIAVIVGTVVFAYIDAPNVLPPPHRRQREWWG